MNFNILASVMIGGSVGALLRHTASFFITNNTNTPFPWGTFAVNMIGSFLIGILWQIFDSYPLSPYTRSLLITGGLGAFTTFSTYSLDTVLLLQNGQIRLGLMNTFVSATVSIAAVWMGITAVRHFLLK